MEPISLIVTALAAAAGIIGTKIVEDGYKKLKTALVKRYGQESDVAQALKKVEERPSSEPRQAALKEELGLVHLPPTDPLFDLAKELLALLNKEGHLSNDNYQAILKGSGAIVQGEGAMGGGERSAVVREMKDSVQTTGDHSPAIQAGTYINEQHVHPASQPTKPTGSYRQVYLEEVAKETNLLPLSSVSETFADPGQGESFTLADVYTDLDTTTLRHMEREDELREFLAHMHEKERIPAQETVNQQQRVLMMGDPGSGKSTFAKHAGYLLAKACMAQEPQAWLEKLSPWDHGALWPVWVELRSVAALAKKQNVISEPRDFFLTYLEHLMAQWDIPEFWNEMRECIRSKDGLVVFLLDGLDEVPTSQRQFIVEMVNEISHRYDQHRYLVTCRPYAYIGQPWRLKQFHEVTLAPFSDQQIDRFVENWYDRLVEHQRVTAELARQRQEKLQAACRRPDLRGLAERPLLLMVMAQLHAYKGELPDDRTELYADAVDLLLKRWENRTGKEEGILEHLNVPGLKMSDVEAGLYEVAFHAHAEGAGMDAADIDEGDLLKRLRKYLGNDWNKADEFVNYIRERAGLLIRHKTEAYTFPHRTFQEFLAACHLVAKSDFPKEAADLLRQDASRWKEVFILGCGYAARTKQLGQAIAAVNALCPQDVQQESSNDVEAWRRPHMAGEALLEIGLVGVKREQAGQAVLERVESSLIAAIAQDSKLVAKDRTAAGRTLAKLGDPRKEVLEPMHIEWCDVPAGSFLMGDDKIEYTIPYDYKISRFPMTHAQFQVFVEACGYEKEAYWPEAKEAGMWADGHVQGGPNKKPRGTPEAFREPFNLPNHPVVGVTWYEALAFTRWLTEEMRKKGGLSEGVSIQLPNEPEWEKAVRGTDGRKFPWGEEPDPNKANYRETGISTTSAVGCFPGGVSPSYGVEDMSGNVWEWTRSLYGTYPYPSHEKERRQRENPKSEKSRVLRGGSFGSTEFNMRCAFRNHYHPSYRNSNLGFRVVVSPFSGL